MKKGQVKFGMKKGVGGASEILTTPLDWILTTTATTTTTSPPPSPTPPNPPLQEFYNEQPRLGGETFSAKK